MTLIADYVLDTSRPDAYRVPRMDMNLTCPCCLAEGLGVPSHTGASEHGEGEWWIRVWWSTCAQCGTSVRREANLLLCEGYIEKVTKSPAGAALELLREARTRIEQLEAEVAELKAAPRRGMDLAVRP
jgi:hypothetical protein